MYYHLNVDYEKLVLYTINPKATTKIPKQATTEMYFLKNQQRKKMEWVNHKYFKQRQKKMKGKQNTGGKNRKQEDRLPLNYVTCKWSKRYDLKGYRIM